MDWIHLKDAHVSCIIGVLEHERHVPQPLSVDVSLGMSLTAAAKGDLRDSIDYSALTRQVRFLAEEGGWRMIESLAAAVLRFVLREQASDESPRPARARVVVTKPRALGGTAIPSVEMRGIFGRVRAEQSAVADAVQLARLVEAPEAGAYFMDFGPRASWTAPESLTMLVVSGTLRAGGARFEAGQQVNGGSTITTAERPATVLAVARPPIATEPLVAGSLH